MKFTAPKCYRIVDLKIDRIYLFTMQVGGYGHRAAAGAGNDEIFVI